MVHEMLEREALSQNTLFTGIHENGRPIRILLADDHELVRQGLVRVIGQSHPEWQVVGQASNGVDAIALAEMLKPDVAIVDLSMPGATGLEVTERLSSSVPGIRILILTVHMALPVLKYLRKAGARALLAKNEAPSELVGAIERVLDGESFFASPAARRPLDEIGEDEYIPVQYRLSGRELDVLRLLVQGMVNKEMATELDLSVRTVETHRASIMERLAVDSLGDLTRLAIRDGVIHDEHIHDEHIHDEHIHHEHIHHEHIHHEDIQDAVIRDRVRQDRPVSA